jgi:type I restriction enzyme S subunit
MPESPTLFDDVASRNGEKKASTEGNEGYKQVRHVGRVPRQWRIRQIGELINSLDAGYSASGEDRPAGEDEVGVLKISAVSYDILRPLENKRVPPENQDDLKTSPREGDLIISRSNTPELVGSCVYVYDDFPDLYLPDTLWRIRVDEKKEVIPRYLAYALSGGNIRARIRAIATGTSGSMKKIAMRTFRRLKVPLPPSEEQRRIGKTLTDWDRAIQQVGSLIEKKQKRLHGLRQRLMTGEKRFPRFSESWKNVRLGDVTRELRERNEGEYGINHVYGIKNDEGLTSDTNRDPSGDLSKYKVIPKDAFAYNPMRLDVGSIGRLVESGPGLVSPDYIAFECDPDHLEPAYLDHYRRTHRWEHFVEEVGSGSVRVRIYYRHLKRMKLNLPPLPEQQKIAQFLDTARSEIEKLKEKREALKRQKKGLMQRLLPGAVRTV